MLNVWASWCVACREEHPALVEFARRNVVPVYGLNYRDVRADGMTWPPGWGNPYQASRRFRRAGGHRLRRVWRARDLVIDRQGVVRFKHIGPLTPECCASASSR